MYMREIVDRDIIIYEDEFKSEKYKSKVTTIILDDGAFEYFFKTKKEGKEFFKKHITKFIPQQRRIK